MSSSGSEKQRGQWTWPVILGIGLAVISILYAIYTNYTSKLEKEPTYTIDSTSLISKSQASIPQLKVSYKGTPVKSLTSTNIRFWNAGRKAISRSDISIEGPLYICVPKGANILLFGMIKTTGSNAKPSLKRIITPEGERVLVDFEFLNYNDGFMVQLLTDGNNGGDWKVTGILRDSQPIAITSASAIPTSKQNEYIFLLIFYVFILIVALQMIVSTIRWKNDEYLKIFMWSMLALITIAVVLLLLCLFGITSFLLGNSYIPQTLR